MKQSESTRCNNTLKPSHIIDAHFAEVNVIERCFKIIGWIDVMDCVKLDELEDQLADVTIEEPTMYINGVGSGYDCDAENNNSIHAHVIESDMTDHRSPM